jgi:hypothetical protein
MTSSSMQSMDFFFLLEGGVDRPQLLHGGSIVIALQQDDAPGL